MASFHKETLAKGVDIYLGDCADVLPTLGKVDACVTDPPYGINAARNRDSEKDGWTDFGGDTSWDAERAPPELIKKVIEAGRYSIVWGGNYFTDVLPITDKWLSWDKGQSDFSLADFELAWCSFPGAARRILLARGTALKDGKEHPTQKSLVVMEWCIQQLPYGCETILDPFMGSGTTGLAAVNLGKKFIGIERDVKYFKISKRRIVNSLNQPLLFIDKPE